MKKMCNFKFLLFLLFLPGSLYLTSCVDKSVDLDNLSKDVLADGVFVFPAIKDSRITMRDLLIEYGNNTDDEAVFDSTSTVHPGLVALYYEKTTTYNASAGGEKNINGGFGNLKFVMNDVDFKITVEPDGNGQVSGNIDINSNIRVSDPRDAHNITRIELKGAIARFTPIAGITLKTIQVGDLKTPVPVNAWVCNLGDVTIKENDEIKITYSLVGGDIVFPDVNMHVTSTDYVVWGWFDYKENYVKKEENFDADISKYLEESNFIFCDPQFEFTIKNNNVGVPLIFRLRDIAVNEGLSNTKSLSFNPNSVNPNNGGYPFPMLYPNMVNKDVPFVLYNVNVEKAGPVSGGYDFVTHPDPGKTDVKVFQPKDNGGYNFDKNIYSDLIGTFLKKVSAVYDLMTDPAKYNTGDEQFISSQGTIDVYIKALLPFWVNKGLLAYTDTITDLDLGDDKDYEILDNTTVTLRFTYNNHLPFNMYVRASLLDENNKPITIGGKTYKEPESFFAKGSVANQVVTSATSGTLDIVLNKAEYDDLRKAKNMKLVYYSDEPYNKEEHNPPYKEIIQVRTTDYLDVKVEVVVKGSVIFKENK